MKSFGQQLKEFRLRARFTLRRFSERSGFDAGNLCKLEKGYLPAPQDEGVLESFAKVLGLSEDEKSAFVNSARLERGRLPKEALDDEEMLDALPVLFRTINKKRMEGHELDELIEIIRKV